ncbi:hypothetical protein [Streptomyces spiramyceticus]|uniref:Rv1733c family protein n=1 Tax=Streptomyces spiramyceticus TaxID=299717 RepID=UPI00237A76DF|nr:hypothetical protein [Streptomyces spiramyceticus]
MRTAVGVWRRRHSPLCRPTDLVEAWVAFAAVLLIAVAAPAVGWICGSLTGESLHRSVRIQHEQRHPATAVVVRAAPSPAAVPDPEISSERAAHTRVVANWTAYDGSRHTGTVLMTERSPRPGDRFRIWTDAQGRSVQRPLDSATASAHAALAGLGAGAATAGLVEGGRRLVVWRLTQRRYARLDEAWAEVGPDWGRTGAGS